MKGEKREKREIEEKREKREIEKKKEEKKEEKIEDWSSLENKEWWYLPKSVEISEEVFLSVKRLPWTTMKWGRGNLPRKVLPEAHFYPVIEYTIIPVIESLLKMIFPDTSLSIKGCFGNHYRDGKDYLPDHSDNYDAMVVSLTMGAPRLFRFRDNTTKKIVAPKFSLGHGDVFIFSSSINDRYKHGIPKQIQVKDERISLTFFI